jgi:putative Holliday junction resolvase
MGLDLGDRTIGVAVSDPFGWTAQGIDTIRRTDLEEDLRKISELISRYEIEKIVIGFPKNMNGTIGPRGEKALEFASLLKEKTLLDVVLWDERLTTVAAQKMLIEADVSRRKRKRVIDKLAATYILQGYLDSRNNIR